MRNKRASGAPAVAPSSSAVLVSIGVPTYGSPAYLAQSVESVLAQTHASWEMTVSDNGSGGGAAAAAMEPYLDDPRIRVVATGEVVGQSANWTKAIRAGEGPYVAMLHDDDLWDPDYLERRVGFLESHPECGLVFSSMRRIDERGEHLHDMPQYLSEGVHLPRDFVPELYARMIVGVPTVLVRRAAYEAVGFAFSDDFVNMDWEMWMRIGLRYPVGYLAVRDNSNRLHTQSVTSVTRRWGEEELALVAHFDRLIRRDLPEFAVGRRKRNRRRSSALLQAGLDAMEAGEAEAARRYIRDAVKAYPLSVLDPRAPAATAALTLGDRGRGALSRIRARQLRWRIPLHLRDVWRLFTRRGTAP